MSGIMELGKALQFSLKISRLKIVSPIVDCISHIGYMSNTMKENHLAYNKLSQNTSGNVCQAGIDTDNKNLAENESLITFTGDCNTAFIKNTAFNKEVFHITSQCKDNHYLVLWRTHPCLENSSITSSSQTMGNLSISLKSYSVFSRTESCPHLYHIPGFVFQYRCYSIKRKNYSFPELKPEDLEEMFVRGSGPGGQSVNQTANCVVLKHKPSGIVIKCHETRSLEENRKRARMKLEEKLDENLYGDKSYLSQLKTSISDKKEEAKRRNTKRLALKKAFKEKEGLH